MGNFFERRLGIAEQQPRGIVVQPAQPQAPQPPPGYQLVPVQPAYTPPPGYQLVPVQQPGQPVAQPQHVAPQPLNTKQNYQQFMREHDGEKISKYWQGGEAHRLEGALSCPQCGSPTSYTNYSSTMMHGTRPRPHCFECGYNGLFQQADQANWTAA